LVGGEECKGLNPSPKTVVRSRRGAGNEAKFFDCGESEIKTGRGTVLKKASQSKTKVLSKTVWKR